MTRPASRVRRCDCRRVLRVLELLLGTTRSLRCSPTPDPSSMSLEVLPERESVAEPASYRALSISAVFAAGFGVVGVGAVRLVVGGASTGRRAARRAGATRDPPPKRRVDRQRSGDDRAALLIGFWLFGWSWLGFVYATEVPEGYQRIGYGQLQPDPNHPDEPIPPAAKELDGQKVFIKGYVYPTISQHGIREFLLVRDEGSCCFGGNPKITDRIQVTLRDGRT